VAALGARADAERYRRLYADPALAIDVAWAWAGGVTRGALEALPFGGDVVLDIGSGDGLAGAYVAWRGGARVIGLDLREGAKGCAAVLAERLGIRFDVATGTLLRPPRAIRAERPDLVLAFRVLHETDGRADAALAALAGDAPAAILERELPAPEVLRRARARAAAGLPVAEARLIRSTGLDGHGWFPLTLNRRGAPGLDEDGLRAMWEPTVHDPPPWHGYTAELVLEHAGAVPDGHGRWVAGDRVFASEDGRLREV
jgi:SAM-dependent methyltransferase